MMKGKPGLAEGDAVAVAIRGGSDKGASARGVEPDEVPESGFTIGGD
jgi:hypothetical protein